jgi:hypothetical protein
MILIDGHLNKLLEIFFLPKSLFLPFRKNIKSQMLISSSLSPLSTFCLSVRWGEAEKRHVYHSSSFDDCVARACTSEFMHVHVYVAGVIFLKKIFSRESQQWLRWIFDLGSRTRLISDTRCVWLHARMTLNGGVPSGQFNLLVILIKPEDFCMYYFETYIHESNDMQRCIGSCNLT